MGDASLNNAPRVLQEHLDLTFAPPEVVRVGDYNWLKMPDCSYVSIPGHPMLPMKSAVEKLPLNSHITQIIAEVEDVPLGGNYFIMPALTPIQVGSTEPMNISLPDQTIYGKDQLYPDEWYDYRVCNGLDPESNRRVQYVSFYFYPLRYLPTDQKIFLAQHVSFTIIHTEPAEEPPAQTVLKNLIITSDTLEPYAIQLATYKNSTGISSRAVNLTWVYKNYGGIDRQEQIRNCIKDFATSYGITYVTIFGDADQVPVRSVFVNDNEVGEPYVPTDLYYGDLDGTWDDNNDGIYGDRRYDNVDGIPDVYVGRIPPSLASYAQTAVDKIIGYEQQFNTSESWTRRVVLAAGTGSGDGFSNPFGIAFPFLKSYTANINANKDIVKLYEAYGNLSTGSMASELNKGALFANFAGHGNPDTWLFYWVNPWLGQYNGYGIADVQGLTNGFKLPVVTTMACSTARFDDQDCIGEWFVLQPNGGSIAYFGATRIAWGYVDQGITTGLMGEIDWRIYQNFYEGYSRLGQMWGQTAKEYVQNHIWNYKYASVYDAKTLMEFILLGDPTLMVYSASTFEFSLDSASPSSRIVTAGDHTTYSVPVTLVSGSGSVSLSCSGLPSGATCSFNPSSGNPTFSSTLTVYTSTGTPEGTYTLTVAGTGGGQTHFTTVQLVVVVNSTSSTVTVHTEDPAGVPVSSAFVYLNGSLKGATDRTGYLTIIKVPSGNYVLTVRKTGYLDNSTSTIVPPSLTINVTLSKPPNIGWAWKYIISNWKRFIGEKRGKGKSLYDCSYVLFSGTTHGAVLDVSGHKGLLLQAGNRLTEYLATLESTEGREYYDPFWMVNCLGLAARKLMQERWRKVAETFVEKTVVDVETPFLRADEEPTHTGPGGHDFFSKNANIALALMSCLGNKKKAGEILLSKFLPCVPTKFVSRHADENAWNAHLATSLGKAYIITENLEFLRRFFAIMNELADRDREKSAALPRSLSFLRRESWVTFFYANAYVSVTKYLAE